MTPKLDRRGFLKALGALAGGAAVPTPAQAAPEKPLFPEQAVLPKKTAQVMMYPALADMQVFPTWDHDASRWPTADRWEGKGKRLEVNGQPIGEVLDYEMNVARDGGPDMWTMDHAPAGRATRTTLQVHLRARGVGLRPWRMLKVPVRLWITEDTYVDLQAQLERYDPPTWNNPGIVLHFVSYDPVTIAVA